MDAVMIATPVYLHPEHFEAAVKSGKHIYIEKPAGMDVAGCKRVMKASDSADRCGWAEWDRGKSSANDAECRNHDEKIDDSDDAARIDHDDRKLGKASEAGRRKYGEVGLQKHSARENRCCSRYNNATSRSKKSLGR